MLRTASTGHEVISVYRRKLPQTVIPFSSPEGKEIFKEALLEGTMEVSPNEQVQIELYNLIKIAEDLLVDLGHNI